MKVYLPSELRKKSRGELYQLQESCIKILKFLKVDPDTNVCLVAYSRKVEESTNEHECHENYILWLLALIGFTINQLMISNNITINDLAKMIEVIK